MNFWIKIPNNFYPIKEGKIKVIGFFAKNDKKSAVLALLLEEYRRAQYIKTHNSGSFRLLISALPRLLLLIKFFIKRDKAT